MTPDAAAVAVTTHATRGAEIAVREGEQASPPVTRRLAELDGLRGLAVLAVMAYHFNIPLAHHGFLGVDVFFVLSGFLITSILASEWQRAGAVDWRRFYVRRILRLVPAFWLMLVVISPVTPAGDLAAAATYGINWTMALHLRPDNALLGHTWSLAVEWQYYLIWPPVLVLLLSRTSPRNVALVALSLGLASAAWRAVAWQLNPDWIRVFSGTDTHADGLLFGSALGLAVTFGLLPSRVRRRLSSAALLAIALAVALVLLPPLPFAFFAIVGDLVVAIATAIVVARVAVDPPKMLSRVFGFAPLAGVGVISYGLYLWHVPIVNQGILYAAGPAVVTLATFVAAGLSYRYLEAPLLRLKRRAVVAG